MASSGGLGVMRQFIGTVGDGMVRDLLLSVAAPRVRDAAAALDAAELAMMSKDDERTQLRYASALAEWGEAGGYDAEVHWDACCVAALGQPYEQVKNLAGARLLPGHGARGHPRSLVRAVLRPVPRLHPRRQGRRVIRAGVGMKREDRWRV
ncbi:MAG TPA: hypothetical protein VGG16_27810 [Streptosporangiaceae bacterium]